MLSTALIPVFMFLIPFCPTLPTLALALGAMGLYMGAVDCLATLNIIQTFEERVAPFLQVMSTRRKGKFLYSAVSSPQDRSKRFTLYFPDRPVHSDTISASLGSIQPLMREGRNRLPPSFPRAMDKQTVVQCQRQG